MIIITKEEFAALCLASHSLQLGKSITPILHLREPKEVAVDYKHVILNSSMIIGLIGEVR